MPQSISRVYVHLIFSTKHRQRWLDDSVRPKVHAYLAVVARDMGCPYVVVGGVEDHVHMLMDIGKQALPINIVAKVKKASSKYIKTFGNEYSNFYWQAGYGMFSVGPTHLKDVRQYVENQVEHHKRVTFNDEFRTFLNRYEIDFDERYVWD